MIVFQPPNATVTYKFEDQDNMLVVVQDSGDANQPVIIQAGAIFQGTPGTQGSIGPSLYDLWKSEGNTGSLDDFLETLRGPPGISPPISGSTYTFNQTNPASVWLIVHNLNRKPSITLIDSAGDEFDADCNYVDSNTIRVTIIAPCAGQAILN